MTAASSKGGGEAGAASVESRWRLEGVGGEAAFHDTAESVAVKASNTSLGEFDVVVLTDISVRCSLFD
jgi:hypothetical protein